MRFGVCVVAYEPHGWLAPIPKRNGWLALHDIGITDVRVSVDLAPIQKPYQFGEPIQYDFSTLDLWIGEPNLLVYLNLQGTPPWASQGQPAYIGGVSRWPPHSPETPESYGGTLWWNNPKEPQRGAHFFDQNPKRTDTTIDAIDGRVISGPELAAVDAQMPARPYLVDPPHRNPTSANDAGYAITEYYQFKIDSLGIGNEPGGFDDPVMRQDTIAFGGKLGDTVKNRLFPELVVPFSKGVRDSRVNARLVGPEADSDAILLRCLIEEQAYYDARPAGVDCYSTLSIHPYGDLLGGDYRTTEAFMKVWNGWKATHPKDSRPIQVGEIGGDPQALYDWTVATITNHPEFKKIYYLDPSYFFEPGSWPTKPVVSSVGQKFAKLFKAHLDPGF